MLELRDLRVHFDISKRGKGKTVVMAVNGVSLTIDKGDALGLVGESGSGKTTVGKAALHLVPITGGRFLIDGEDMTRLDRATERKLRRKAQIVFQDPHSSLNPRMTIYRSVAEPLILHTKVRGAAMRKRVSELLEVVGLPGQFLYRYPHELSGGQKQRVCIARALALNPELLILDEPTSALDVSVQSQILEFLKDLQKDLGLTYLFISHNLAGGAIHLQPRRGDVIWAESSRKAIPRRCSASLAIPIPRRCSAPYPIPRPSSPTGASP